ncbi:MAG: protein-glutamate O-methyltransferase CheR [Pseudomonadota bacterium]
MDASKASYQIIADLLAQETGQHLAEGRLWRVSSALSGVFRDHGISNIDQLVCLLDQENRSRLSQEVVEALLNNETYFFRDKPTFDQLPHRVLPELAKRRKNRKRLSIWCAGCSTGQEAYSIAMAVINEPAKWRGWSVEIFGTDVSNQAILAAQKGHYTQFEVQRGLGVIDMLKHFEETETGWQITSKAKTLARFEQHNMLDKPPALHAFDLVLCRNVLLYFDSKVRERAFKRLKSAMTKDGFLMLGAGETVVGQTDAFVPLEHATSLYEIRQDSSV